jgi:hypothetical protein
MNANNLSSQERIERRAAYEQFRMVVCANGYVNIVNQSHNDDTNHTYSVEVTGNGAVSCSCPHHQQRNATCKHMVAITDRPLIISSAQALNQSHQSVATDGGGVATEDESASEPVCDECDDTEHGPGGLIDVSDSDWHEYDRLCSVCVIDVGGPDDSPEDDNDSQGVVDVGHCRCGNYVYGDDEYCSEQCEKNGPINTAPL